MVHVMRLHDSVSGRHYELTLEQAAGAWLARWVVRDGGGALVADAASGALTRGDSHAAFRAAKELIEDADPDVQGNDWDFQPPLPEWLTQ